MNDFDRSSLRILLLLSIWVVVVLAVLFVCDANGEELSVSNADIFAGRCNPVVNMEGVLKAEVDIEFYHPTHANIVLVKAGTDTAEVYRTSAEPEPRKNLRIVCGGWQLQEGATYQLLLVYRPVGEKVQKIFLASGINRSPKNLVAKK